VRVYVCVYVSHIHTRLFVYHLMAGVYERRAPPVMDVALVNAVHPPASGGNFLYDGVTTAAADWFTVGTRYWVKWWAVAPVSYVVLTLSVFLAWLAALYVTRKTRLVTRPEEEEAKNGHMVSWFESIMGTRRQWVTRLMAVLLVEGALYLLPATTTTSWLAWCVRWAIRLVAGPILAMTVANALLRMLDATPD